MVQNPPSVRMSGFAALKSFTVGFCVFALGSLLAAWLDQHNIHGLLAFMDNLVTGVAAGLAVLLYERRRKRDIEKKLRTIGLMNHHVRNALQGIYAASSTLDDKEQTTRIILDAVTRIEWTLREVLPGEIDHTYF